MLGKLALLALGVVVRGQAPTEKPKLVWDFAANVTKVVHGKPESSSYVAWILIFTTLSTNGFIAGAPIYCVNHSILTNSRPNSM